MAPGFGSIFGILSGFKQAGRAQTLSQHMNLPASWQPLLDTFGNGPTVLVVDDDQDMVTLLRLSLQRAGARILSANSGAQALQLMTRHHPDVILLDISMPEMDGLTVCERLRDLTVAPIIMVTGLNLIGRLTSAFAAGADDYVIKPYDTGQLLIRIQTLLWPALQANTAEETLILRDGDLMLDLARQRVWVRRRYVHLTGPESKLLVYLARKRGQALALRLLITDIWGQDSKIGEDDLKQFVGSLRRKIELDPSHPEWLVMDPGVGYTLLPE